MQASLKSSTRASIARPKVIRLRTPAYRFTICFWALEQGPLPPQQISQLFSHVMNFVALGACRLAARP